MLSRSERSVPVDASGAGGRGPSGPSGVGTHGAVLKSVIYPPLMQMVSSDFASNAKDALWGLKRAVDGVASADPNDVVAMRLLEGVVSAIAGHSDARVRALIPGGLDASRRARSPEDESPSPDGVAARSVASSHLLRRWRGQIRSITPTE